MISIVAEVDGRLVAAVEVAVRPRGAVVDRTLRLQATEGEFLKQRLRLGVPTVPTALALALGDPSLAAASSGPVDLQVRCSDPHAVVAVGSSAPGGIGPKDEVLLKLKCGAAGSGAHPVWILVYTDRHLSRLVETWLVLVTPMKRVDLAAAVGQTTHGAVVVRGGDRTRPVDVYCSHPDEVTAAPDSFQLVAAALGELTLSFKPLAAGRLDAVLHLVDRETGGVHPGVVFLIMEWVSPSFARGHTRATALTPAPPSIPPVPPLPAASPPPRPTASSVPPDH